MTTFRIDIRGVQSLAESLVTLTGERLGGAALQGVNDVSRRAYVSITDAEVAGLNLRPAYVKSKTDLALATNFATPQAVLTSNENLTPLGNFDPIATQRAGRGNSVPRRAGPRVGRRNAGLLLQIKRGVTLRENQWFTLPLRRGEIPGGNGLGVFVRSSSLSPSATATREGRFGKRHVYGPSPNSLFLFQTKKQGEAIEADLEQTVVDAVLAAVNEGLK